MFNLIPVFILSAVAASADTVAGLDSVSIDDHTILRQECVLGAPVAEVWKLWTTQEGAEQWIAPRVKMDFRIGGSWRASYHPESTLDDQHTIENTILAFDPHRMIAFRCTRASDDFPFREQIMGTWSVVYFEPVGRDHTRLISVGLGYTDDPKSQQMRQYFERNNPILFELLASLLTDGNADEGDTAGQPESRVECEIAIPAGLDEVWRAWTTNEGVQSFLAGSSDIGLRVGGPYEIYFLPDAPEGARGSEGCRVLSFLPHEMLSFTWNAPPNFPHAREHHTWVVLHFKQRSDGVHLRLTHLGWDEMLAAHPDHREEWIAVRDYFNRVWPHVLSHLRAVLSSAVDEPTSHLEG